MAEISIEDMLRARIAELTEQLKGLAELQAQKEKLEAALKLLTSPDILLDMAKAKISDKPRVMAPEHRLKIKVSNLRNKAENDPNNLELRVKLRDAEAELKKVEALKVAHINVEAT